MLHLRRLSYFLAVLDYGTIIAAAEATRIAQPALSRQIRTLENETGLTLFTRERGRLLPTPAAARLEAIARTLLEQASLAERAVETLSAGPVAHLVCATTRATAEGLLAPFILTLKENDPRITCRETAHGEVEQQLSRGADFAISPLPPSQFVGSVRLGTIPVLAAVSEQHEWARDKRHEVPITELAKEFLILPSPATLSRQEVDVALRRNGLPLGPHVEQDSQATSLALATASRGVAITTTIGSSPLWPVVVVGINGAPLAMTLYACWRREHHAGSELGVLAKRLAQFMRAQILNNYAL